MEEIKEFLIGMYNTTDNEHVKERIKILLKNEVTTYCKCSKCGNKFSPDDEENFKSGISMYPENL